MDNVDAKRDKQPQQLDGVVGCVAIRFRFFRRDSIRNREVVSDLRTHSFDDLGGESGTVSQAMAEINGVMLLMPVAAIATAVASPGIVALVREGGEELLK